MHPEPSSFPAIDSYYPRSASGNAVRVDMSATLSVWFSYTTAVAFRLGPPSVAPVVRKNVWSRTTGAHLNAIDGGSEGAVRARLGSDQWETRYRRALGPRAVARLDRVRVEIVPEEGPSDDCRLIVEYDTASPPLVEFHRGPH